VGLRSYDEITEGSTQRQQLQVKLTQLLQSFGLDRCGRHLWPDCAWALCKAYEIAPKETPLDARCPRALAEAEKKLAKDKSYSPCRFSH
jgi:hypothetical protein